MNQKAINIMFAILIVASMLLIFKQGDVVLQLTDVVIQQNQELTQLRDEIEELKKAHHDGGR